MLNYQFPRLTLWTQFNAAGIRLALADIHAAKIKLDVDTIEAVAQARALGLTWEEIARPLNISRQAAWQNWNHLDRAVDHS
jgi:predicted DNA-binding protein (UPF0251 family)